MTKTSDELCDRIARVIRVDDDPTDVFNALIRQIDRIDPSYKS